MLTKRPGDQTPGQDQLPNGHSEGESPTQDQPNGDAPKKGDQDEGQNGELTVDRGRTMLTIFRRRG